MNTPLRRVGLAMLAMIILLLANATYIQIVKADDYRNDSRNNRVLYDEYARQRGRIQSQFGGAIIANVTPTNDRLRYLRQYTNGPLYAPVTGFYSVRYGASGLERAEDSILNGSDDRLFVRRLSDLITGRDPRGGNIVVTINPQAQQAAYDALKSKDFNGAVVALRPQTGEILAMVSTPSFDPNTLAAHDAEAQEKAYNQVSDANAPRKPLLNRAISENYFPGSTFKLVIASAALEDGKDKNTQLTAANGINVLNGQPCRPGPNETTCQANFNNKPCGDGGGATVSMETALQFSCNTAFAQLAHDLGEDKVREQSAKYGIGETDLAIPMPVTQSCIGPKAGGNCLNVVDEPALYQTGIGQRDVRLTAMQNAEIVATIANAGVRMRPQLIKQILAPDLDEISNFEPDRMDRAISESNANTLRDMMKLSEEHTFGGNPNNNPQIASKTGTAETGADPKNTPPYAWYVAFAPADNPKIAVAVVVESKDEAATGGKLSASIGRATMRAALAGGDLTMLTSGQLLADRYRLARRIAVGGMGEVWEAADTRLDRRVAVKVLKPELCGDAEFLHRFRTEARTTASLNHPGIAAVHDYGETSGVVDGPKDTAYLVMELVEGEPLAAVLARERRISPERTLDLLEQAGNALQAAHERGYVHRDVKPGNILMVPRADGQTTVKLTDFGIAKAADAAPVTRSGMVMGTAHYIAPEQALGHEAEPASDVYSLAVVGYECLAGHRPFLSENAVTVAMMHIRDLPPPLPPDVPPHARAVIEATLVKDPRQRYGSGAEFAAAVAAVRAGMPLPVPSGRSLTPARHGGLTGPPPGSLPGPPTGPPTGTQPRIMAPGPPMLGSGAFAPLPPPRSRRSRAWVWVLLAVLLVALALLAAFGIPALLRSRGSSDNQDSPGTGTSVSTPGHDAEPGGPPRRSGLPGEKPGRLVTVDPSRYLSRSAAFAVSDLSNAGLTTKVLTLAGEAPNDLDTCVVTEVTPAGGTPIGSAVTIRCQQQNAPPG